MNKKKTSYKVDLVVDLYENDPKKAEAFIRKCLSPYLSKEEFIVYAKAHNLDEPVPPLSEDDSYLKSFFKM